MTVEEHKLPSNRSFGLVFITFFSILSSWQFWRGTPWGWVWLIAALLVLAVTLFAPDGLTQFNRAWMRFGLLLHKLVSPIVLGVLYFGVVTPTGLIMRLLGHDPLRRRYDPDARSYWLDRQPPGPPPSSLDRQF